MSSVYWFCVLCVIYFLYGMMSTNRDILKWCIAEVSKRVSSHLRCCDVQWPGWSASSQGEGGTQKTQLASWGEAQGEGPRDHESRRWIQEVNVAVVGAVSQTWCLVYKPAARLLSHFDVWLELRLGHLCICFEFWLIMYKRKILRRCCCCVVYDTYCSKQYCKVMSAISQLVWHAYACPH